MEVKGEMQACIQNYSNLIRTLTQPPAYAWLPELQGQVENPQYMVGGHPLKS